MNKSPVGEVNGYAIDPSATSVCSSIPFHSLRTGTAVNVESPANAGDDTTPTTGFCLLGCVYDAAGIPDSVAGPGLPFPGFRQLSLVLHVGTQTVQGGIRTNFTTRESGPLEICVNDDSFWGRPWRVRLVVQWTN